MADPYGYDFNEEETVEDRTVEEKKAANEASDDAKDEKTYRFTNIDKALYGRREGDRMGGFQIKFQVFRVQEFLMYDDYVANRIYDVAECEGQKSFSHLSLILDHADRHGMDTDELHFHCVCC